MNEPGPKPFETSKQVVAAACEEVKRKKGAAGVDGVAVEQFAQDYQNNLYKPWNRMSSGSYFPAPVRMVEIPKDGGRGTRVLGVPTVADRIAQTVAVAYLEPCPLGMGAVDDPLKSGPGTSNIPLLSKF